MVFVDLPVDFEVSDEAMNTASSDACEGFSLENIFSPLTKYEKVRYFSLLTDKWVIYHNYIIFLFRGKESVLLL